VKRKNEKKPRSVIANQSIPLPEVKNLKRKAEANEVAGQHKNDGQMGHKGAR
jgi:hypothetical protein